MTDIKPSRQQISLTKMPESGKLMLFSDQQEDNFKKSQSIITASSFVRLGMRKADFKDCSFTQSNFEDFVPIKNALVLRFETSAYLVRCLLGRYFCLCRLVIDPLR